MGFLAPVMLAALAALAIPVLVHLTHKERREPVMFPSLMFLQRIPFRSQKRQRLRHILLFALRALVLILLAAAFARPFFERRLAAAEGARDVIVVMDRSASMGAGGRWPRAQAAAREAIGRAAPGARVAVVAFDDRAEALTELTTERAQALAAIERLQPGSGAGRFGPGLQVAAALAERRAGPAEVVLVSDFQRAGWEPSSAPRLAPGITVTPSDVGDSTLANVAVLSVVHERESGAQGRSVITARVGAMNGEAREVPVRLDVDGRDVQTVRVRLVPGAAALAAFSPMRDPETPRRAIISVPADDQPADDAFHFVLGPAPRLGVLALTRADAPPRDVLFLRQALEVAADPAFPVQVRTPQVRAADLAAAEAVILHDAPFPGGDAGRRLIAWVQQGGGLLIALGARGTLPAEVSETLGNASAVVDRGDAGAAAASVDVAHPVFEGWARTTGFHTSRAFRYRRIDSPTALARWDDGVPALVEVKLGEGRVLIWTSDFANRWSDLPLHPSFVPLVHGLVRHLAGFTPPRPGRLVGDVVELDAAPAEPVIVDNPAGRRTALPAGEPARVRLAERGFYQARSRSQSEPTLLAANVPPAEADPARVAPAQIVAAVEAEAGTEALEAGPGALPPDRGRRLWWYVLAAVLLLFATESAVAHRTRGIR